MLPHFLRFAEYLNQLPEDKREPKAQEMKELGRHFRARRNALGLTREELIERMNNIEPLTEITAVQISAFESGLTPLEDLPEDFGLRMIKISGNENK